MANEGFVQARRGVFRHLQTRQMSWREWCVFHLLLYLVDSSSGIWHGCSEALRAHCGSGDVTLRYCREALHELEAKGYIKRWRTHGQRGNYPIAVDKYEVTSGVLRGKRLNVALSVSYNALNYDERTEDVTETVPDDAPEDVTYNKTNTETERMVGGGGPSSSSLTDGPSAPAMPPVSSEKEAITLMQTLFTLVGSPEEAKQASIAQQWEKQARQALAHTELEPLIAALKAHFEHGSWWANKIREADWPMAFTAKSTDKIIAAAAAASRKKPVAAKQAKQSRPRYQYQKLATEEDFYGSNNPSFKP